MIWRPSLFVSSRFLLGRRGSGHGRKGYLRGAVAGMALSVIPLTLVLFVTNGMIQGITSRYLETSTYHLQASPAYSLDAPDLLEASGKLSRVEGVKGAWAEIQGPGVILASPKEGHQAAPRGALVRALDPGLLEDAGFLTYLQAKDGTIAFRKDNDVLLGAALARSLGAGVGELVSLVTSREGSPGLSPRLSTFRVRGIVSTGYQELDSLWALIPLKAGSRILAPGSRRVFVGIKAASPYADLVGLQERLRSALAPGDGGFGGWGVSTWEESESNLWRSFSTTKALLLLIMALAVAVAAVNVGGSLVTLVLERRKDIAILRSSGARARQVGLVFVSAGLITGGLGTVIGLALGTGLSLLINPLLSALEYLLGLILRLGAFLAGRPDPSPLRLLNPAYYLEKIPVDISLGGILAIGAASLVLCGLASLIPARRASRLPPMEIFRKG